MIRRCAGSSAARRRTVCAASPSQIGRFETQWLAADKNLLALADLSGQWIDRVPTRRPPRGIVLDMDSSVSPTSRRTREQRLERPLCLHLLSSALRVQPVRWPGTMFASSRQIHSADGWEGVLKPVVERYQGMFVLACALCRP